MLGGIIEVEVGEVGTSHEREREGTIGGQVSENIPIKRKVVAIVEEGDGRRSYIWLQL